MDFQFFTNSDKKLSGKNRLQLDDLKLEPEDLGEGWFDSDLHTGPLVSGQETLFLGRISQERVLHLLEKTGVLPSIRAKGYEGLKVRMERLSEMDQRIWIESDPGMLVHIRLKRADFRLPLQPDSPVLPLLYIDWLETRHILKGNCPADTAFPGQRYPGLGIFPEIIHFFQELAHAVKAKGAFNIPEYFHDALLFRRRFQFYDPSREALFRTTLRDLRRYGARRISIAYAEGRVRDGKGRSVAWRPAEMLSIQDPSLRQWIFPAAYEESVRRGMGRLSLFIIDPS